MNLLYKFFATVLVCINLTACLYGQCMDGPCALERKRILDNIKPYGAHWVKEGMTREGRKEAFINCGGGADMKEGYDIQSGQSTSDFFKRFNVHVTQVAACMRNNGYSYLEEWDARCMYP
jgi:hypothetical protein